MTDNRLMVTNLRDGKADGQSFFSFDVSNVSLGGVKIFGAAFHDGSFDHSNMVGGHMINVYMKVVSFAGCNLAGVCFDGCRFIDCDFGYANLQGCTFRDTYLSDCEFENANLKYVTFQRGLISGIHINEANGIYILGPGGVDHDMLYVIDHNPHIMIKRGCFWGNLDEFKAKVEQKPYGKSKLYYQQLVIPLLEKLRTYWDGITSS